MSICIKYFDTRIVIVIPLLCTTDPEVPKLSLNDPFWIFIVIIIFAFAVLSNLWDTVIT